MKNKILKMVLMGTLLLNIVGFSHTSRIGKRKGVEKPSINEVITSQRTIKKTGVKVIKQNSSYIGIDKAKSIALSRVRGANNSHVRKLKFDYEDGRPVYEGEIRYNGWEYDFEIDAVTGKIVKWEKDRD